MEVYEVTHLAQQEPVVQEPVVEVSEGTARYQTHAEGYRSVSAPLRIHVGNNEGDNGCGQEEGESYPVGQFPKDTKSRPFVVDEEEFPWL